MVLFHFNSMVNNPSEEPVFNSDVAWPDDAAIIHARDLNANISAVGHPGDRNRPLYEYYSHRSRTGILSLQPRRREREAETIGNARRTADRNGR